MIKKNDTVTVLSGKDKGRKGVIIEILHKNGKIKVKDIALVTRHVKARKQGQSSSIVKSENYIALSKVMLICNSCKKPTLFNTKLVDNKKVRICKHCHEIT